jgi:preprotein translocase subunit SecA
VLIYSALDDALFLQFGGERIRDMMTKMGMTATEPLEHTMISSAIARAQEKLEKKVSLEQAAHNAKAWLEKNIAS